MMATTTFSLFLIARVKGILGLGPFPEGEMLTRADGYHTEPNNYLHLETQLSATHKSVFVTAILTAFSMLPQWIAETPWVFF